MSGFLNRSVFACVTLILGATAQAALIDNGSFTTDDVSGLDWLDITETVNISFNDLVIQLGSGGAYEDWNLASHSDVQTLISDNISGNSHRFIRNKVSIHILEFDA